jgi:Beta protein
METQFTFIHDTTLAPMPVDARFYVPTLFKRKGEMDALARASDEVWDRMIPLIQIAPVRRKGKPNQINGGTVTGWMTDLAGAVGDRPFLLDVVRRGPSTLSSFRIARCRCSRGCTSRRESEACDSSLSLASATYRHVRSPWSPPPSTRTVGAAP